MTKSEFLNDDRFCQVTKSDIACAGGSESRAIARLLDEDSDTAFCAVLDLDGGKVWTAQRQADGGQLLDADNLPMIEWGSLADFII